MINGKQIKGLPAEKITTSEDLQFVSRTEKDFWNSNIMMYLGIRENESELESIEEPVNGSLVFINNEKLFYIYIESERKWRPLKPNYVYNNLKAIRIEVSYVNQKKIKTGIFNQQGLGLFSKHTDILLSIDGLVQRPSIDYTTKFNEDKELVIDFIAEDYELTLEDTVIIYFNNTVEKKGNVDFNINNDVSAVFWDDIQNKPDIGDISKLKTEDKSSIINAINEVFQSVVNGKKIIASAITDRGIPTSNRETFRSLAQKILSIRNAIEVKKPTQLFDIRVQSEEPVKNIKEGTIWIKDNIKYDGTVIINDSEQLKLKFEELSKDNKAMLLFLLKDNIFEYDRYLVRSSNLSQIDNQVIDFNGLSIKFYNNHSIIDLDSYVWDGSMWVNTTKKGILSGGDFIYSTSTNGEIIKSTPDGHIVWERKVPDNYRIIGIELDSNNNLYVALENYSVFKVDIDNKFKWEYNCTVKNLMIDKNDLIYIQTNDNEIIVLDTIGNYKTRMNVDIKTTETFTTDGTYFYLLHENQIRKYNNKFTLIDCIKTEYKILSNLVVMSNDVFVIVSNEYSKGNIGHYKFNGDKEGKLIEISKDVLNFPIMQKIDNKKLAVTNFHTSYVYKFEDDKLVKISDIDQRFIGLDKDNKNNLYLVNDNSFTTKYAIDGTELEKFDNLHSDYTSFIKFSKEDIRTEYLIYTLHDKILKKIDCDTENEIWKHEFINPVKIIRNDFYFICVDEITKEIIKIDKNNGNVLTKINCKSDITNCKIEVIEDLLLVLGMKSRNIVKIDLNTFSIVKEFNTKITRNINDFIAISKDNYLLLVNEDKKFKICKVDRDFNIIDERATLRLKSSSRFKKSKNSIYINNENSVFKIEGGLVLKEIYKDIYLSDTNNGGVYDIVTSKEDFIFISALDSVIVKIDNEGKRLWSNLFAKYSEDRTEIPYKFINVDKEIAIYNSESIAILKENGILFSYKNFNEGEIISIEYK